MYKQFLVKYYIISANIPQDYFLETGASYCSMHLMGIINAAFPDYCGNNCNNFLMQVMQTSNTLGSFNKPFANLQFTNYFIN